MDKIIDRSVDIGPFLTREDDDIIICRCEEITKGEIRKAVHDGMMTMTEVKRYLRAGMGLCQGQTCSRLVKNIIVKELGITITADKVGNPVSRAPSRPVEMKVLANEDWEGGDSHE